MLKGTLCNVFKSVGFSIAKMVKQKIACVGGYNEKKIGIFLGVENIGNNKNRTVRSIISSKAKVGDCYVTIFSFPGSSEKMKGVKTHFCICYILKTFWIFFSTYSSSLVFCYAWENLFYLLGMVYIKCVPQ